MLKTLYKRIITAVVAVSMLALPMLAPAVALAADDPSQQDTTTKGPNLQNDLGCGATFTTDPGTACENTTTTGAGKVQGVVTTIVDYFSIIVGLLAVIMLIYGGLKYITSGGDSSKAASARTAIVSAIIGLVIVALAQIIVQFVLTKANPNKDQNDNGTNTTGFVIPAGDKRSIG